MLGIVYFPPVDLFEFAVIFVLIRRKSNFVPDLLISCLLLVEKRLRKYIQTFRP